MQLDLQTILALHSMRQMQVPTVPSDEDLLLDDECCPSCGGLLFEDDVEAFTYYCPECDLVAK